jgi:hypothetical protein
MRHNIFFLFFIGLLLPSCATIVSKSEYPVNIQTSPSNVRVAIKDKNGMVIHKGRTPMIVNLKASNGYFDSANYIVEYKYKGITKIKPLSAKFDGWYLGNIMFGVGGIIGFLVVDPLTGAMWKLPEVTSEYFNTENASLINKEGLHVVSVDVLNTKGRSKLIPIQ